MNREQLERITLLITGLVMLYFLFIMARVFGIAGLIGTLLALAVAYVALRLLA